MPARPGCFWRITMYDARADLMPVRRRPHQSVIHAILISVALACSDGPAPTEPKPVETTPPGPAGTEVSPPAPRVLSIARVGGDDQHGTVGSDLASPLAVRVTDAAGAGLPDVA